MRQRKSFTEQQLVDEFRKGDEKAFSGLFRLLYATMCFYALQIIGDQAAAEDIVEEAFLKIWDRRETFYNYNVLRSFLYKMVRNDSINWLKKEQRQCIHEKETLLHAEPAEACVLENIVRAEVFHDMYSAFEKLPPKCRQIISMIFFDGMNSREVAEALGLSIGTVKTQKARGLMLLRNRLLMVALLFFISALR